MVAVEGTPKYVVTFQAGKMIDLEILQSSEVMSNVTGG